MRKVLKWIVYSILFITTLLGINSANAQIIHPVTASLQLVPPYSVYLADYAAPGNDKLRVILTLNDLSQPSYTVRLRLKIELNGRVIMQTDPVYRGSAITLMPGMPQIITGSQLNEYLVSDHLQFMNGFSRENYERTKALPEGAYRICVTAYDYNRSDNVAISNDGCNIFFFQKNEAPLLNFPLCNSRVDRKDPQFLNFTWSIRNTPSFVTGSSGTGYRFELFEVRPAGSNPEYIVRSSTPVYTATTDNAMLLYGPGEPRLQDSMQYVWRVQAYDKDGRDAYQNNGYSQACVFTYGGLDPFVVGNIGKPELMGEALGERSGKWWWHISNGKTVDGWNLQYRKRDTTGSKNNAFDWNKKYLTDTLFHLFNLEPDNTYEAQVQPVIRGIAGSYSETVLFRTMPKRVYECGKNDTANFGMGAEAAGQPLNSAIAGMIVKVGDFEMQLLEVSGGNGRFSGYGAITTPLLGMKLNVKFTDVTINDKLQLTQGEAVALTEGIDAWIKDRTKVKDDVENIKDWSETMPNFETASLSELKDFATELLGISEGVWNDTYVYTEEERKQVKDALAEIKAAMEELEDSDPSNDAAAEKKLRDTLKKVEPLLEKLSDNIGKGVLVQLGLTRKKLYKAVIANYIKELQTSLTSLGKERAMQNALAKHGPHNEEGIRRLMAKLPACMQSLDETKQKALADYLQQKISIETDLTNYLETLETKIAKQEADKTAIDNAEKHLEDAGKNKADLTVEEWAAANPNIFTDVNERMCPYVVEEFNAIQGMDAFIVPGNASFVVLSLPSKVYLFPYGLAVSFMEDIKYLNGGRIEIGGKKYISLFKAGSHDFKGFFDESKLAGMPKDKDGVYKEADLDKAVNDWLPKDKYKVKYQLKQTYTRELFEDLQKNDDVDKEKAFEIAALLDGVKKEVYDLYLKLAWKDREDQEIGLYELGYGLSTVAQFEKALNDFIALVKKRVTALDTYVKKWEAEKDSKKKNILRDIILKKILWQFEEQDYLSIGNDLRDRTRNILMDGNLSSQNLGDKAAMKLVTKVPPDEQKSWLETLSTGNRLKELFSRVDGDEFRMMMSALSSMVMTHFPKPADLTPEKYLEEGRYISLKTGFVRGDVLELKINDDGTMHLESREQFTNDIKYAFGKGTEWVIVQFKSDFELNDKLKFKAGDKRPMPVILAYLLCNEENNRRIGQAGKIALDITLTAVGLAEFRAAMAATSRLEKAIRVTKAIADLGVGITDIVINDVLAEKLNQTDSGKAFLDSWNTISLYYGLGSIGAEIGLYARKLYKEGKWLQELEGADKLDDKLADQLTEVMNDVEKKTGITNTERAVANATKDILKIFDWTSEVVKEGSKYGIRLIKDGGNVGVAFLKGKSVYFEGKLCAVGVPFVQNVAAAKDEVSRIIQDIRINGFLRDEAGKLKVTQADEIIAEATDGAGHTLHVLVKDWETALIENLKNKNLANALKQDLATNAAFKKLIQENEELVTAWEVLETAGLSAKRVDAAELERLRKLIKDNNLSIEAAVNAVKAEQKLALLGKLNNLPFARDFVNTLDEVADAALINRINSLNQTQLDNLNTFYKNRPSPAGFGINDYNFTATKTINGQQVSIDFTHGFPDFHHTPYCPSMAYPDGTVGKFKFESNSLIGTGTDFTQANEALLNKFGLQKASPKNAQGFYQSGNYRWNGTSSQFELQNASGVWEKYTWHHFEDGKTMFPVLSAVHSPGAGAGGYVHPGGKAIIGGGIKDIFVFTGF